MRAHQTIVRLLGSLGSEREVRQYLQHFSSLDDPKFGVIQVGSTVLEDATEKEALADALSFLSEVNLHPVVVHGGRPAAVRAATPGGLAALRDENLALVEALVARGTHARPVSAGVVEAAPVDEGGVVYGDVSAVDVGPVASCTRTGYLPVIAALGETPSGQVLHVDADAVTLAVARALAPLKVVFLNEAGGILDENDRLMPAVNLAEDFERVLGSPALEGVMRRRVEQVKLLLDDLPPTSSVSITSPSHLARELFTHKGAGTLLRRGERITRRESFDGVDIARARDLLERCFGRKLAGDYFEERRPLAVYLDEAYRALAVVIREAGEPYLDKLAVTTEAQGAGVGASLWNRMTADFPRLFWRSRRTNPINPWYFGKADTSFKTDAWVVFTVGITDFVEVQKVVERALALPPSFGDHAESDA